jgi:hypothetical protein
LFTLFTLFFLEHAGYPIYSVSILPKEHSKYAQF